MSRTHRHFFRCPVQSKIPSTPIFDFYFPPPYLPQDPNYINIIMATPMSDKETKAAKKAAIAAAKARAKQWHEEKNGGVKKTNGGGVRKSQSPKKKPPPAKRTPSKKAAATTDDTPDVQYRKTPSRAERKKTREEARSKAAEWHNQRNNKATKVPAVVDTEKSVEEDELSDVDDFKTAQARLSLSPRVDANVAAELKLLSNDIKNVLNRVAHLTERCSPAKEGAPMDCD